MFLLSAREFSTTRNALLDSVIALSSSVTVQRVTRAGESLIIGSARILGATAGETRATSESLVARICAEYLERSLSH